MEVISRPSAPASDRHSSIRILSSYSSHDPSLVDGKPALYADNLYENEDEEFAEDGEGETRSTSKASLHRQLQRLGEGDSKGGHKAAVAKFCGCPPCECDLDPMPLNDREGEDECIPSDAIEEKPVDLSVPFYEKLQDHLSNLRRHYCLDTLGKPPPTRLTRELISVLLIERKDIGQVFCYLPGNELYPRLLPRRVNDKDMCNICSVLGKHMMISTLNFAYNDIGDLGLKRLARAIKLCGNISHVNLMHNNFTAVGLEHLLHALVDRDPLQTLRLTGVKFGDAGIDVLTCLLLSGKAPTNLDIGECDLSIDGFQTLSTALHALDHDIDAPEFLASRKLPLDLEALKNRKQRYNDERAEVFALTSDSDPAAAELRRWTEKNAQGKPAWDRQQKLRMDGQEEEKETPSNKIPLIFQEFSATLLESLFDVQHKLRVPEILAQSRQSQSVINSGTELAEAEKITTLALENFELSAANLAFDDLLRRRLLADESVAGPDDMAERIASLALEEIQLSAGILAKSRQITEKAKLLGSLDEYIHQYRIKEPPKAPTADAEDYHSHPVVSPSLYKLDFDGDEQLLSEFTYELDNQDEEDANTHEQLYHGQVIDFNQPVLKRNVDESIANQVAKLMTQDFFRSAAESVTASGPISEKANIIQLLYMALVDLECVRAGASAPSNYFVRECTEVMDTAIEAVQAVLIPRIPEECATLSEDMVKTFARSLVETASKSFLSLLNNDTIAQALARDGSLACRQATFRPHERERESEPQPSNNDTLTEDQIRFMAMEFVNGAIEEAGRLIGSGDPFGFHTKHANVKKFHAEKAHEQEKSTGTSVAVRAAAQQILDVELGICDAVDKLIDMGGQLAAAAKEAQAPHEFEKLFQEAANEFVASLFGDVREELSEYLQKNEHSGGQEEIDKEALKQLKHAHISRPTRLVLNRPFFAHYKDLMATKLGEYLEGNHTLKALHIQKWGLGEDGMLSLMNGLMKNKTLRMLDLSCNSLGADGMEMLGVYLATNKNLKHLVLNHNGLKDPGVINLIAQIVESNLISLNIAYNNVTWVGLDRLLRAIPDTKIYALYLWGNQFGLETWRLFQHLLATGTLTHSDTLLQQIDDDTFCTVKNSEARDAMNQYYDVPLKCEGLIVPPYMTDPVYALNYED